MIMTIWLIKYTPWNVKYPVVTIICTPDKEICDDYAIIKTDIDSKLL